MILQHLGSSQNLVVIGNSVFYFSYNTCVAVRNEAVKLRINSPSKTTSRHMRSMGVFDWPIVTEEELEQYLPKTPSTLNQTRMRHNMYSYETFVAEDGTEFNTLQEAIEYERPWVNANNLLEAGESLFDALTVLEYDQPWSLREEKLLKSITKNTEIYWRRYKADNLVRKVVSIDFNGDVYLVGEEKNTGKRLSPIELVKHIFQFYSY